MTETAPIIMTRTASIIMMGATALACGESAPANPTWATDVQPILAANCTKCHIPPPLDGAPTTFRLDIYEETVNDEGVQILGAEQMGMFGSIAFQITSEDRPMPPRFPLTDRQIEVLQNWTDNGAPKGAAKAGNRAPTMEATLDAANVDADGFLTIPYVIDDEDFDIVWGELNANGAADELITRELHSGSGEAIWDVAAAAEGAYDLVATIDDGSARIDVNLGSFDVVHANGNTAPRVTVDFPAAEPFTSINRTAGTTLVCNTTDDCLDGTDEASCMGADFLCANATAVAKAVVCDGVDDCGDGSDEANCGCGAGLFTCADNQCIGGTDVRIVLTVVDPDAADTLTMSIEAFFRTDQIIEVATDIPAANFFDWDTTDLAANGDYRLRVTVSDGTITRTVTTAPFALN